MASTRNIKVWICILCIAMSMAAPTPGPLVLDIVDMAAISRMTPQQLEVLAEGLAAEAIMRTKRSSAQSIQSAIKASVSSASSAILQKKVSLLGQASSGSASFLSSKSGGGEHGYSYEPHEEKVDYWGLKKSILYTLFQAVKAITGGVTILKGQLIKGGGALAATLGKVISKKGDVVSNLGRKIVSSAALSHKPVSTSGPVYGPPPTAHFEYGPPPSAYGAPTAPAHYAQPAISGPTGWAPHKYPAQFDGRGKLSGLQAGLVILAPLNDEAPKDSYSSGNTPLEPPPSILSNVFSAFHAIKDSFASKAPLVEDSSLNYQVPPPPPSYNSVASWGAVNSYGEPAMLDSYSDYEPQNHHLAHDYAAAKKSVGTSYPSSRQKNGLTLEKLQKINNNLEKLNNYMNEHQRSSEELPKVNKNFSDILKSPYLPTPVVTDNEIGVLPGDLLTEFVTTSTTSTTTTTAAPSVNATTQARSKKEIKFMLRGNKIVQV